jgi:predicted GNAT family N-acyltransferase
MLTSVNVTFKHVIGSTELAGAFSVRRIVFIQEQSIAEDEEYDGLDGDCLQFVAISNRNVIGTARVRFLSPSVAKIERMAVLKEFRRLGVGQGIVANIESELKAKSVLEIVLHAQMVAIPFYLACGFFTTGPTFYEAGIEHIKMQKCIDTWG